MTRKDFELIAKVLKEARDSSMYHVPNGSESPFIHGINNAAYVLANALATTNPRFDRARFLAACGVQS